MPDIPEAPALDGIHHVKLPVRDLDRSREWYASRLGYADVIEFIEGGQLVAYSMHHPRGGPNIGLWLDPARAEAAGFDYFSIAITDKSAMDKLAERLTALGDAYNGVDFALYGWVLHVYDPDGHELRFYTREHHTSMEDLKSTRRTIRDYRKTAAKLEQEYNNARAQAANTA
ncbi:MAG: VOC family protein [Pseudonocardiaceae bacterium]